MREEENARGISPEESELDSILEAFWKRMKQVKCYKSRTLKNREKLKLMLRLTICGGRQWKSYLKQKREKVKIVTRQRRRG